MSTASGMTLGSIGILPLIPDVDKHSFVHKFILCTKLKQSQLIGLDFAQRYKIGLDVNAYGTLFLLHEGKKKVTSKEKSNSEHMIAKNGMSLVEK